MKARSGVCAQQQAGETHLNDLRPPKFLTSNYLPSSGEENCDFSGRSKLWPTETKGKK